jgi:hypothetical protein
MKKSILYTLAIIGLVISIPTLVLFFLAFLKFWDRSLLLGIGRIPDWVYTLLLISSLLTNIVSFIQSCHQKEKALKIISTIGLVLSSLVIIMGIIMFGLGLVLFIGGLALS